jgi:hypothetical protein
MVRDHNTIPAEIVPTEIGIQLRNRLSESTSDCSNRTGNQTPANGSLADNPFEDDRKVRLRTEAHHGGHIGYRQLWIEKEPL